MANIVKINAVRLCIGVTNPAALQATFDCKQILDDNGIKYVNLIYPDTAQYPQIFENMSTWVFGSDFTQYNFDDFPILTWQEYYDDFEICDQVAFSTEMLLASNLIQFKQLVEVNESVPE